ncbi:MAG: hypothetical protein NTV51_05330 [Verrucomicrobia bacterium]|nr:hypothetical protein [Verrucomicrobiota bacterium]
MVFLLGALSALGGPAFQRSRIAARSAAVEADLRAFAAALQTYAQEKGDWPPGDSTPGALPFGLETRLDAAAWRRPTPIGGRYTWSPNTVQQGERYRAAIVIASDATTAVSTDPVQLTDLDRRLDDGRLDAGKLRLGFRNQPVYVLEH